MARTPDSLLRLNMKLAIGGWVQVCRANAERLAKLAYVEVQVKYFLRSWRPMDETYVYKVRAQFRARQQPLSKGG